jgi:anti-sigma factor RsiW
MTEEHHCSELLGNLSEYIDGTLQAELCADIELHLADCEKCRVVVNTLRKTVELYCPGEDEPVELPIDVRERLFARLNLQDYLVKKEGK